MSCEELFCPTLVQLPENSEIEQFNRLFKKRLNKENDIGFFLTIPVMNKNILMILQDHLRNQVCENILKKTEVPKTLAVWQIQRCYHRIMCEWFENQLQMYIIHKCIYDDKNHIHLALQLKSFLSLRLQRQNDKTYFCNNKTLFLQR